MVSAELASVQRSAVPEGATAKRAAAEALVHSEAARLERLPAACCQPVAAVRRSAIRFGRFRLLDWERARLAH
ncbi:hypothetical protein NSPZN2_10363 [Nitrospira defluvii]|uniref:Uncharacterized protein n=1 Tax=Nitrospira defluvii TaxID=330214 RepID=A0ABM8QFS6_9BACT|nr:hypothetical protein NSPZN2_10363 [Nitrospira defluvii]